MSTEGIAEYRQHIEHVYAKVAEHLDAAEGFVRPIDELPADEKSLIWRDNGPSDSVRALWANTHALLALYYQNELPPGRPR